MLPSSAKEGGRRGEEGRRRLTKGKGEDREETARGSSARWERLVRGDIVVGLEEEEEEEEEEEKEEDIKMNK